MGMGVGVGAQFRTMLGIPYANKYVFQPKINFLDMAHTNLFFSSPFAWQHISLWFAPQLVNSYMLKLQTTTFKIRKSKNVSHGCFIFVFEYLYIYIYIYRGSYCRDSGGLAADLILLTPIVPKSSRKKKSACIACCGNHPGSVVAGFANVPQRKCLHVKLTH